MSASRRRARARRLAVLAIVPTAALVGCDAVWGIGPLDTDDVGDGSMAATPAGGHGTTTSSGDGGASALSDGTTMRTLVDGGTMEDSGPHLTFCQRNASPDAAICDDFDEYTDGAISPGLWEVPHPDASVGSFDVIFGSGDDAGGALHVRSEANGSNFTQIAFFHNLPTEYRTIEIELDVSFGDNPVPNDFISFAAIDFESPQPVYPRRYSIGPSYDWTGFHLGYTPGDNEGFDPDFPTGIEAGTHVWTHVDLRLTLSTTDSDPTDFASMSIGDMATPVLDHVDVSGPGATGVASFSLGMTYVPTGAAAHDLYLDNVLVTVAP